MSKQSWIITAMMLWVLIFCCEMMVTNGTAFDPKVNGNTINELMSPSMTNMAGSQSNLLTFVTNIGNYLYGFISIIFLWSPTVFAGYAIYLWFILCMPIGVSFAIGIVMFLRGSR